MPQFGGSLRVPGSLPPLADKTQVTCGGRFVVIYRSVPQPLNCGEVGSSPSDWYQPMRRALSLRRITGDSSWVAPVACLLCRSPTVFWSRECLSITTSLRAFAGPPVFRMVIAIALRVALTGSHDVAQLWGPMRPSPFTHRSRSVRTAVACAAFHDLVTWTRPAVDARVVVPAYTWSALHLDCRCPRGSVATDPG